MQKTVHIGGKDLSFATITNGVAKSFPLSGMDGKPLTNIEFNERLVVNSLVASGKTLEDAQKTVDDFPYFGDAGNHFSLALEAAIEVNGLKKASDTGKDSPEPTAEQASE